MEKINKDLIDLIVEAFEMYGTDIVPTNNRFRDSLTKENNVEILWFSTLKDMSTHVVLKQKSQDD
jgi:hypothetical protein